MKTRFAVGLLVLSMFGIFGMAIHPATSHASTVGQQIFFDDFENANGLPAGWTSELDGSVGCSSPATTKDDVSTYVTTDNWPDHGRVMTVHANVHSEPLTVANSLAVRGFTYQGGGNYQTDLYMRLWRTDGNYANSYYGMNLTINRNHTEHFAEVNVETNPSNPNYGDLMYKRVNSSGQTERASIAHVGEDTNWHHLIVNVYVDVNAGTYRLQSVFIDGTWHTLAETLPTRSVSWADFNHLFMESNALWTGCGASGPNVTHIGIALFDNVKLTYFPW